MARTDIQHGQTQYLLRGGPFEMPLQMLYKSGVLQEDYVYREYPKMLRLSQGVQDVERSTEDCKGRVINWTERKEIFQEIVVHSEEEEERVLAGGKTSVELEQERLGLLQRCRSMGIHADPSWSAIRLRRELGDALDAPAPVDNMAKLEAELASLKKMAAMQAEIEALRAQLAKPSDESEELRAQLTELGVKVDGRWSIHRLRDELEKATGG
jgi:hypothetical protein